MTAADSGVPARDDVDDVDVDVDDIETWRAMTLAHAGAVRAIERDVQRVGITLTWYDVLRELDSADGRQLHMQELSDRVVLSRTRVSRLVDEMAVDGLVLKRPDADDRRSTWAVITADGLSLLHDATPAYIAGVREHFNRHLTEAERRAVTAALRKVAAANSTARNPVRSRSRAT